MKNISTAFPALLVLVLAFNSGDGQISGKEKLLALIKKLEKIVRTSGEKSAAEEVAVTEATTLSSKDSAPFAKDPSKTYCDEAKECDYAAPPCTEKDIILFGNLRRSFPIPIIHQVCGRRAAIANKDKMFKEAENGCCAYNMTMPSYNSEREWNCAKETMKKNKCKIQVHKIYTLNPCQMVPAPADGQKFWTSGRFSKTCGKYIWCPEKEVITDKWKPGFPKENAGDCVVIQIGSMNPDDDGFFNTKCSKNMFYHCYGQDKNLN